MLATTALLALAGGARAQVGPHLDPAFRPQAFYQPAYALAMQLADGSRIITKAPRVNEQNVPELARLLPSGEFDFVFGANVANYSWQLQSIVEAPGNKLLVLLEKPAVLGGQPVGKLLRLNANGTLDASFRPPTLGLTIYSLTALPDGQVLVAGKADHAGGAGLPYGALLRLTASGAVDTAFQPAISNGYNSEYVTGAQRQPDGKLLITGDFTSINGQPRAELARLQADGTLDGSFALPRPNVGVWFNIYGLAPLPNGQLLLSSSVGYRLPSGLVRHVLRLNADGSLDASFVAPEDLGAFGLRVRADGRIYAGYYATQGQAVRGVVRLLPTGAYDPHWKFQYYGPNQAIGVGQLLPTGELLVAGNPVPYGSPAAVPTGVALLDTAGVYEPGFAPLLHRPADVQRLAQQPDGKLLVGGAFTFTQGQAVQGLVRLHPNGELDTTFSRRSRLGGPGFSQVNDVVLQPDGKVLITGNFTQAGGLSRWGVARLLPTGEGDASFAPPFVAPANVSTFGGGGALLVQPSGRVLAGGGGLGPVAGQYRPLWGLTATGQVDPSFQSTFSFYNVFGLVGQPDGRAVLITDGSPQRVLRLLASGAPDPSFKTLSFVNDLFTNSYGYSSLARYPDGRLLVGGYFHEMGGITTDGVVRLLPDGTPDPTFHVVLPNYDNSVQTLAVLHNERVALGLSAPFADLLRLLPDGSADASFSFANAQPGYGIASIVEQPANALVIGGAFEQVLGQSRLGLARLLDGVALAAGPSAAAATTAWPVPAHDALHLTLDAARGPRQVQLLDALGRVVLTQAAAGATLTLPTAALPPGVYLLRVAYASSAPVTRRVVLE